MSPTEPQPTSDLKTITIPPGASPFLDLLQFSRIEIGQGRGRIEMTVQHRHLRPMGILHGGMLCSLLDSLLGLSAGSVAPEDHHVVTAQLNVNFIRPAWEGEKLIATGEVAHAGKMTAVVHGEVRTDKGVLVGSGTGTFIYLPHTKETRQQWHRLDDEEIRKTRG